MDNQTDEILLDLESHFAVPAITANDAHHEAKAKLSAREVAIRIDELNGLIEEGETIVHQSDIFDRIKELEKLQGGHNGADSQDTEEAQSE